MKPVLKGIYVLFDGEEIVYIGQSSDIYRRIYEHQSGRAKGEKKDFTSWDYFEIEDDEQRIKAESLLIRILNPKYNIDTSNHYCQKFAEPTSENDDAICKLEWFVRNFFRFSSSMSCNDCDFLFGFPLGTFYSLVRNGDIDANDVLPDICGIKRIKLDAVERMAKKLLKNKNVNR